MKNTLLKINLYWESTFYNLDGLYTYYLQEQFSYLFFYVSGSLLLTFLLFFIAFLVSDKNSSFEKLSPYECGFEPFSNSHSVFNVQFFIVGILFMVFDLELLFLFPWVLNMGSLDLHSFCIMILFLFLLTVGFIYEWKKGVLEWI